MNGAPDPDPKQPSLEDIDARLRAVRDRRKVEARPARRTGGQWAGAEFAWRMVIDLTAGVAVGSAIGWGLDSLFGTKPLFLLAFVLLGFAAGVRVMLQSAKELQRRNKAAGSAAETETGAGAPQDEGR